MNEDDKSKLFPNPKKTAEDIFAVHNERFEQIGRTQRMFSTVILGSFILWAIGIGVVIYVAHHFISKFW